jgi:hypothetical protein
MQVEAIERSFRIIGHRTKSLIFTQAPIMANDQPVARATATYRHYGSPMDVSRSLGLL